MKMIRPELLAPAGNPERLKIALAYGADAVYIGGKDFGLRAFADNFTDVEMEKGIEYAHSLNKKVYVTMNIFAHNSDFTGMEEYIKWIHEVGADAVIVSDPGVFSLVKETASELEIHISTQANITNWRSAYYWHSQGAKRIILGRELSLEEIREIRRNTPDTLELEAFIHGAMCMSYSGRCTISNYLTGRDANRGECAQPCRWKYYLVEEQRPGEYMPVVEDDRGAYFFNSKDLAMLAHIPELMESGLSSFKIEGRMKTAYYVATVVQAYRREIDKYLGDPEGYSFDPEALNELKKASHRPFTTGFYLHKPTGEDNEYRSSKYIRGYDFVGLVKGFDKEKGMYLVEQRNNFSVGDRLEIMQPGEQYTDYIVEELYDADMCPIDNAPHPQQQLYMPFDMTLKPFTILRKAKGSG